MKQNRLGKSDLYVSEIGLGTMSLPKGKKEAIYLIHEALDRGVNLIDTADLYGYGKIETLLGEALKGRRSQAVLATKAGNHWDTDKEGWYWDPSKRYIKEAVKGSLKRLKTDYIDLFQLHGGTIDDPVEETIEAFEELKQEGVIRAYGISSIRPNIIREYIAKSSIATVMMQYSILDRRPEESILGLLERRGISVIARGPVAQGILSDQGLRKIPENGYLDYSKQALKDILTNLNQKLPNKRPLSETAIRYVLAAPAVAAAVPGASRLAQLLSNIAAVSSPELGNSELEMIRQLSKANIYQNHR